ncbi:uncharacterized protein FOMMEDRAFT_160824 [Fomitiporia mediterranea MF3/22]|uniref:uncharacterized protein n=1 Tax=Fomitiporia mediterranea (strain MF3/22) TaxID=694068 RepID=UPI0004407749|nr:uncharacterized protein FOMMEDRAFT_160824 [Fomitiporia mediterranea MF3/22]EJC99230.1 hypothetical protein FOMMEDRAFT_160824 [Fomitiporia mediterranea MF3/22]
MAPEPVYGSPEFSGDISLDWTEWLNYIYAVQWSVLIVRFVVIHLTMVVGTRILAIGMFPPGNDSLTANYSIDGGQPTLSSVPFISQSTSLLYQQFFASQNLSSGLHNITITILETGPSRNYSFQSFTVFQDIAEGGSNTNSPHELDGASDTNIAAIVGGVLGAVIVLLFCLLGWSHFKRRRMSLLRRSTGTDESVNSASGINPFMLPPVGVVEPTVECTNLPQSVFSCTNAIFNSKGLIRKFRRSYWRSSSGKERLLLTEREAPPQKAVGVVSSAPLVLVIWTIALREIIAKKLPYAHVKNARIAIRTSIEHQLRRFQAKTSQVFCETFETCI